MAASSTVVSGSGPAPQVRSLWQRVRAGDELAYWLTFVAAASILVITGLLVFELYTHSAASRAK